MPTSRRSTACQAADYYALTMEAGAAAGVTFGQLGVVAFGASFALIPMIVFFNLWPNWGSTLYGEVRGAADYKRNFWGMASAVDRDGRSGPDLLRV